MFNMFRTTNELVLSKNRHSGFWFLTFVTLWSPSGQQAVSSQSTNTRNQNRGQGEPTRKSPFEPEHLKHKTSLQSHFFIPDKVARGR